VVFVGEFTRNLGLDILSQALFGLILIFVTFFAPGGIVGFGKQVKARIIQVVPQPPEGVALDLPSSEPSDDVVPEPAV